ncbi:hypothetical protein JCM15124A_04380 [Prevotella falsenii]
MAQGQDANYKWNGNPIASVTSATDDDIKTVYLYNVGTGKFLNAGSYWSTVTVGYRIGMGINITNSATASGKYQMNGDTQTTEGQKIAFGRKMDTPGPDNPENYNHVYVDRGSMHNGHVNGILDWSFDETAAGSKTYIIHFVNDEDSEGMGGKRYLRLNPGNGEAKLTMEYPNNVNRNDPYYQWKIVTRKDLKDAFKAAFASDEAPADATFLIEDQNFSRSHKAIAKWVISSGLTSKPTDNNYSFLSNEGTYYVGMGSARSDRYQSKYAAYWIGNIRNIGDNNHANGTVTQTVKILKKGWYVLSCDGFYNADNGSNMVSSFFAKVNGTTSGVSNVSAVLNRFNDEFSYTVEELTKVYGGDDVNTESPYVKAGKLFDDGKYSNSLMVYVPADNTDLKIGVEVTGSTGRLDWTTFDNFQLRYCGDRDMVLDEAQTSLDYLRKQGLAPNSAYTLILKRTMTPNLWSSITLPVALTAAQFKTAFGDHAKLARLKGQDENIPTRIDFESVSLSNDNATVIEPSKLYIMKSVKAANVATGSYEKTLNDHTKITVTAPYFTINNVVLTGMPSETFAESSKSTTTEAGNIQFCGTQINQTTKFVPAHSYVLGAKNGKWHYTSSALPIKGFRCWIATNVNGTSPAKDLTFAIDGTVEGDVTGIEGIERDLPQMRMNGAVYNLQGQKVADNATDLNSLPTGIYIVNNKKVLIK